MLARRPALARIRFQLILELRIILNRFLNARPQKNGVKKI